MVGKTRGDAFVCVLEKSVDLLAYPDIVIRWFKTGTSSSTEYQRNVANISFVAEETGKFGIYIVDCYRPNTKPIVRGQGMCYVNATVFRSASTPTGTCCLTLTFGVCCTVQGLFYYAYITHVRALLD